MYDKNEKYLVKEVCKIMYLKVGFIKPVKPNISNTGQHPT